MGDSSDIYQWYWGVIESIRAEAVARAGGADADTMHDTITELVLEEARGWTAAQCLHVLVSSDSRFDVVESVQSPDAVGMTKAAIRAAMMDARYLVGRGWNHG